MTAYVSVVLIYALLSWITPFVYVMESTVFGQIMYVFIGLAGGLLLVEGFVNGLMPSRTFGFGLYVAFGVVMVASALWNYQYDLVGNMKAAVLQFVQLCVFASFVPVLGSLDKARSFFKRIYSVSLVIWTIACLVSLVQFLMHFSMYLSFSDEMVRRQGFMGGRLFGIFQDPNFAAITSLLLIVLALYFFYKKMVIYKEATIIALAINFAYLVAADSRTAYVCLAVGFIAVAAILLYEKKKWHDPLVFKKRMRSLAAGFLGTFIIIGVASLVVSSYAQWSQEVFGRYDVSSTTSKEAQLAVRDDVDVSNLSNNRFDIWESYISASLDSSFPFGRGYRSMVEQMSDFYPDSYIASSHYEPHNAYVLLYVATGITGSLIWFAFFIMLIAEFRLYLQAERKISAGMLTAVIVLVIVLAKGFFFTSIWFVNNLDSYLFLLIVGYLGFVFSESPAMLSPRCEEAAR